MAICQIDFLRVAASSNHAFENGRVMKKRAAQRKR